MVENVKITATELKRYLKISIYLPKSYNLSNKEYPVIYVFDGQMMIHSLDDNDKSFDLPTILDSQDKECICMCLHSAKIEDWRKSELCPYYIKDNSQVDPDLSKIYLNYIVNTIHPTFKERYRFSNDVYLLGFKEGAILPIYALYHHDLFKGAGCFSPTLEICEGIYEDIKENININKKLYLYYGGNDDNMNLFYDLSTKIERELCDLKISYQENMDNTFSSWEKYISEYINYILP